MTTPKLINLPPDAIRVTDADEEPRMKVFLLYTRLAGLNAAQEGEAWAGLGSYNPRSDSLSLQIDLSPPSVQAIAKLEKSPRSNRKAKQHATPNRPIGKQVQVELLQDTTSLKSRKGDTGSVLWRVSVCLAKLILTQLEFPSTLPALPLFNHELLKASHCLELGSGTGLLGILLSRYTKRYTITDVEPLLPLIQKNLALNLPSSNTNVIVEELDWVSLHSMLPSSRSRCFSTEGPVNLLLCVDCIFNESLLAPLVATIDHLVDGTGVALVVVELRQEDVVREFLRLWIELPNWEIWRAGEDFLGPQFAAWVGWKIATK